jgi:peptidoglycan/LPS O-acetylase OafA/YrhL
MQRSHRFHELDLLRGIACALVLLFHYLYRGQLGHWLSESPPDWVAGAARYGYLGVHLFFIISGFVIFMTADGATPRAFVASRVGRLYPAFWVAAPLTALVALLMGSTTFGATPSQLAVNLTMLPQWFNVKYVDGAYWSLAVELQFYIFVWLALVSGGFRRPERLLVGWMLLATLVAIRPIYKLEFWLDANWAPFFTAGICCYLIRQRGLTRARLALLGWAFLLCVYFASVQPFRSPTEGPNWSIASALVAAGVIAVFFCAFLLIAFNRWRMAASPLTLWAGALTYPVYLLHQDIGYMVIEAAGWRQVPFGLRVLCTALMVVAAAWALHRFVEKPLGPWLRRLVGGSRRLQPAVS